jgi:RNA polymerase sigma factor (sigma-70 family)
MENPAGYLYRVGQSRSRRLRRPAVRAVVRSPDRTPWVKPRLDAALGRLTANQRAAVVLCHGLQWTHREVAELLGIAPSSVQNRVERGLDKLRALLGGEREPAR